MADFNDALRTASLAILKRELSDDERTEFLELGAALGMDNVEDYLYMLMIFKRNEDRLGRKFDDLTALEKKIHETLEGSVERILHDGADRIGREMGDVIAERADRTLAAVGGYHTVRGQMSVVCFTCLTSALAYWLGSWNVLRVVPAGGALEAFLFLPAGWCVFFCGAVYSFLWVGDYWGRIRRTAFYKALLGVQLFLLSMLALTLW